MNKMLINYYKQLFQKNVSLLFNTTNTLINYNSIYLKN
jgi:hypothetical protein